jgi:hypothetical protein
MIGRRVFVKRTSLQRIIVRPPHDDECAVPTLASLSSKGLAHPVVGGRWTLNMRLAPNSNPPNRHFSWDSTVWVKFQRHA